MTFAVGDYVMWDGGKWLVLGAHKGRLWLEECKTGCQMLIHEFAVFRA